MIHIVSLGAGVQSSTMALMAAHGEIEPMPECAIFADTQAEPQAVYEWLDWLEKQLPFPVYRVTAGSLMAESLELKKTKDGKGQYVRNVIPAYFINDKTGHKGMLLRKCTADFKVAPIKRKQRELLKQNGQKKLSSWIGISVDEASRMKPSGVNYATNRWPLIELGMRRLDCLKWMEKRGYPHPIKSACFFCPYMPNAQWRELKRHHPKDFQAAVKFEKDWNISIQRDDRPSQLNGTIYLHRDCKPLGEIDLDTAEDHGQVDMFKNECEGMCGV